MQLFIRRALRPQFHPWAAQRSSCIRLSSSSSSTTPAQPSQRRSIPDRPPPPSKPKTPATESSEAMTSNSTQTPATGKPSASENRGNIERGQEAARRYVKTGYKDPRYKGDARRVMAIIAALPVVLVTSYFLFQRRFLGVEQKKRPVLVS